MHVSDHAERQNAAEADLYAVKVEAEEAELAASAERTEARGWPILLEDGSEVMVVRKEATPAGVTLVAEDGTRYEPTGKGMAHVEVGRDQTDAENDEVEASPSTPEPPADESGEGA